MLDGFGYDSFRLASHCKLLKAGSISLHALVNFRFKSGVLKHVIIQLTTLKLITYTNDVGKKVFLEK